MAEGNWNNNQYYDRNVNTSNVINSNLDNKNYVSNSG